jgi:hypothetical protein
MIDTHDLHYFPVHPIHDNERKPLKDQLSRTRGLPHAAAVRKSPERLHSLVESANC